MAEERRQEMLEFLDKLMDLGELADQTATSIIFKGSALGALMGMPKRDDRTLEPSYRGEQTSKIAIFRRGSRERQEGFKPDRPPVRTSGACPGPPGRLRKPSSANLFLQPGIQLARVYDFPGQQNNPSSWREVVAYQPKDFAPGHEGPAKHKIGLSARHKSFCAPRKTRVPGREFAPAQ